MNIVMRAGLLLLTILLYTVTVQAAIEVEGLYEIEIPVKDQGAEERRNALKEALSTILLRLSGSKAMAQPGQFNLILERASRYVDQYRYRQPEPDVQTSSGSGLLLWVRFNKNAVEQLLRDQALPLWSSTRPETLLWLGIEDKAGRYILGSDKANPVYRSVVRHASNLAVPLLMPLMDLEDRRQVRISDIWGGFSGPVRSASGRYNADNIVIAKLYPDLDGWRGYWILLSGSREKNWTSRGKYPDQAIADGMGNLADLMIARYAVKLTGELSRYRLVINNVNTLNDYDASRKYLASVSLISDFHLQHVSNGQVTYLIDLRGDLRDLEQVLNLERRLLEDVPVENSKPVALPGVQVISAEKVAQDLQPAIETLYYRLKK